MTASIGVGSWGPGLDEFRAREGAHGRNVVESAEYGTWPSAIHSSDDEEEGEEDIVYLDVEPDDVDTGMFDYLLEDQYIDE